MFRRVGAAMLGDSGVVWGLGVLGWWGGRTSCLLYTSDAADERSSVDLGGRRIIKKKTAATGTAVPLMNNKNSKRRTDEIHPE